MDVSKPLNSTDDLPPKTVRPKRQKRRKKARISDSERLVISWFGWDIAFPELISEETFQRWLNRIHALCLMRGWIIERLGNPIDLIFGCPARSITRREFFQFQRDWDALNHEFELRFSACLYLMTVNGKRTDDLPVESYRDGLKRDGDSIGRPWRHDKKRVKPDAPTKEIEPIRSADKKPRVRKEGR